MPEEDPAAVVTMPGRTELDVQPDCPLAFGHPNGDTHDDHSGTGPLVLTIGGLIRPVMPVVMVLPGQDIASTAHQPRRGWRTSALLSRRRPDRHLTTHQAITATTSTGDQATILSVSRRFQAVRNSCPSFSINGTIRSPPTTDASRVGPRARAAAYASL